MTINGGVSINLYITVDLNQKIKKNFALMGLFTVNTLL